MKQQIENHLPLVLGRAKNTTSSRVQRKCACGGTPGPTGECEACRKKREQALLQRKASEPASLGRQRSNAVPPLVHEVLRGPGSPLDPGIRTDMEPRFGHDFSGVRVHTDGKAAQSAAAVSAQAYTVGHNVVFAAGQYRPNSATGLELMAHELAHVVQQGGGDARSGAKSPVLNSSLTLEREADSAAGAVTRGEAAPALQPVPDAALQRKIEFRDVGRGEQSGFARLPELIDRLNAISARLIFSLKGNVLAYEAKPGGATSNFDLKMMAFIDSGGLIPLRLTNRHGLLGDRVGGFHFGVEADAWASGYVDIDDLLASSDLGLQLLLVHFISERGATSNYAHRIGSTSMEGPAADREFTRAHGLGIDAEVALLRDFFSDPSIRFTFEGAGEIFRNYRNSRGDRFRARMRALRGAQQGVDATNVEVVTPDNKVHTPEEYLQLREEERTRAQIDRERLGGATEHRAGGRNIPAP